MTFDIVLEIGNLDFEIIIMSFPSINDLTKKDDDQNAPQTGADWDSTKSKFDRKMGDIRIKELEQEASAFATASGLQYLDLTGFPVSPEALRAVPEAIAREKNLVCFYYSPSELRVGVLLPLEENDDFIYQLGERHHAPVITYLISEHSLEKVLKLYATLPIVKPITKDVNITDEELNKFGSDIKDLAGLEKKFLNISITDILSLMISAAIKLNASDIHVEAEEKGIAVRYRVDGVLHEVANLPHSEWEKFISRIKLLSALKINVNNRPQDGRVTIKLDSGSLDLRVSTLPTTYGESVVMRILHSGTKGVMFDELGIRGAAYVRLKREIERPNGMIVTTGPTGSGKTTTLYAILRTLNKPGVKIITVEDPVEIKMQGVVQSQVDIARDYTFAKALRSILRQDPDICMVGEIRDLESAEIAIQSALTGHLLLSTIHTNSASGAIPRFMSMGVKPFLLAPALNAVMGQRLVRRICEKCIEEQELDSEMLERVGKIIASLPAEEKARVTEKGLTFYHGKGCPECSGLGYKGRIGIYEIFVMTKEIESLILGGGASEYEIQELAAKDGMLTMAQDGILKALDKMTSVEEVFRVSE